MSKHERGPDRRRGRGEPTFPLRLDNGELVTADRRGSGDRRRNAFISQQEICRGLPYSALECLLETCSIRDLAPGEALLQPGQVNHYLFLLISGVLRVHLHALDSDLGLSIEPGQCVGEMSIIDGKPTSAYVTAVEPCRVMAVDEDLFWSQIAPMPGAARNLLRVLAERMRLRNDVMLRSLEQELRYQHLQRELQAASNIQIGMLPHQKPFFPDHPGIDVQAHMHAAKGVGGDFFDAFSIDENRVCLAVGDVSGKGMPAAMFMVRTVTLLRVELMKGDSLQRSISNLNNSLCVADAARMFVSLFVAVLDVRSGDLEYVNAGHNPPLARLGERSFRRIDMPEGLVAGIVEDSDYEIGRLTLQPDDMLLLYTDGVTEARNAARAFYTLERLEALLSQLPGDEPEAMIQSIVADVEAFAGEEPQADDITLLALRFVAPARHAR